MIARAQRDGRILVRGFYVSFTKDERSIFEWWAIQSNRFRQVISAQKMKQRPGSQLVFAGQEPIMLMVDGPDGFFSGLRYWAQPTHGHTRYFQGAAAQRITEAFDVTTRPPDLDCYDRDGAS